MDIGYARVSTAKQDLDRQIDALRAEGIPEKRIYVDKKSGFNTNRPGLQAALDYVGDGDVIVVHTLDRLGRAVRDTLNMIHDLSDRGSRSALSRGSYPGRLSKAGQPDVATCPGDAGSVRADGKNVRRRTRRTCTGRGRQQRQANRQALGRRPDQTGLRRAPKRGRAEYPPNRRENRDHAIEPLPTPTTQATRIPDGRWIASTARSRPKPYRPVGSRCTTPPPWSLT